MKPRTWLMIGLWCINGVAFAEGGSCPPGYYPIGGQGTQGCAPIPNYNGSQQAQQPAVSPQPTGYWEKTWGAIAPSPKGGVLGTASGASSKEEAERLALADCKAKGGGACKIGMAYRNQCVAMVLGDVKYFTASAASLKEAKDEGIQYCRENDKTCSVYYSACTEPIFHQY